MKRFVVFSDLHLHQWNYGATVVNGRNSRLEQQKQVVKDIVTYCTEKDITQCVFTGDLFHTSSISAEVSQAAYEAFKGFKENKIDLTVLVGNHDQSSRTGELHALGFFRELGRVIETNTCEDNGGHDKRIAGLNATFIPYTESKSELERRLAKARGGLIFMHQGVGGVEVNAKGFTLNEILTPDMIPRDCAMAFTGHYHSFKPVSSNLVIPGSTVQLNWGDEGEQRGWLDVAVDGEQVTEINFIESNASKFITINETDLFANQEILRPSSFIRVLSTGSFSPSEIAERLRESSPASTEIKPIAKDVKFEKSQIVTIASLNEVVYSFAASKEKAGVISSYDRTVGEQLLKGNYYVPYV